MVNVDLKAHKILKLTYCNEKNTQEQNIQIESTLSTNANYDTKSSLCFCTYVLTMASTSEKSDFKIEIKLVGIFSYSTQDEKKEVHLESAKQLYPILQSTLSNLLKNANLSDIKLPEFNLTINDVQ